MLIDHSVLMPFLREFSSLTQKQQAIFLFCLEHVPNPTNHTGDLLRIRTAVKCKPRTLQVALRVINNTTILSKLVKYRKVNIRKLANGFQ